MTFADLAEHVASNLKPDGDSVVPIPSVGPFVTTPYGKRVARLLRLFTTEVPILFATMTPFAIGADVRELTLTDPGVCPLSFWYVRRLWLTNRPVTRLDSASQVMKDWTPTGPTGSPAYFAHLNPTKIVFDRMTSEGMADSYLEGWYRHPAITDDADLLDGAVEDRLELLDRYVSASLRQDAASDDIGLARLQRVDAQAAAAIRRIRGEAMRSLIGTVERA